MTTRRALLIAFIVLFSLMGLTQFLAFQQYHILKTSGHEAISEEANDIRDKLNILLAHSLSATSTLAYVVEKYGEPDNFEALAKKVLEQSTSIDALELTRKGVITDVYPLDGNEVVIGYDVLAEPTTREEALKALNRRELYFAGPIVLKQGGKGVVGRLPIFRDNTFWGFSVVVIKLNSLLSAAGIYNDSSSFSYQLSKQDFATGKEQFFLESEMPTDAQVVSIPAARGQWKLYVFDKQNTGHLAQVLPFSLLGILLSATGALFAWHLAIQPERLRRKVRQVRGQMKVYEEDTTANLRQLNRLLQFTSSVNHMTIHAKDEDELYSEACRIAVDLGRFKLAWIGCIDQEKDVMELRCQSGDDNGYLAGITPIPLRPEGTEKPVQKMLRIQDFVLFNDIAEEPLMKPWAKAALARGFRSAIMLPVKKSGAITASLNLYSEESNPFDENEIQLLLETATNISFALDKFEGKRMQQRAEERIRNEKLLSDSIINSLPGIFYLYDDDGNFVRWNKNFEIVSGYSSDEVRGMHPLDFFGGKERELLDEKIKNVFDAGYDEVSARFLAKDGRLIPHYFNGKRVKFEGVDYLIGMGLDISERVKVEDALAERAQEVERLTAHLQNIREEERSQIALEIHDVLGQQLTALKMDATWIRKKIGENADTEKRIEAMLNLINETIKTVRRIASELRPAMLDDFGLVAALEWQATEFQKNTGVNVKFHSDGCLEEHDKKLSINVFRIYQEALTNIARHAKAEHVDTHFHCTENHIHLVVKDDGKGINLQEIRTGKSLGLISMRERTRLFGGQILLTNNTPQGTVVTLDIPLTKN